MYMVGMGGGVSLFILEVAEVVQACNTIWTQEVESRNADKGFLTQI